jgi:hypothetical protein
MGMRMRLAESWQGHELELELGAGAAVGTLGSTLQ